MSSKPPSRVVFIGNIPYDLSETQIIEIFKEVGPVVNFRMVFDRDTGKPKGYGFCTFPDAEIAASAVRNLNNYDINGRTLRVDYADNDDSTDKPQGRTKPAPMATSNPAPPANSSSADQINSTLNTLQPQQLLEYLSFLKLYSIQDAEHCRLLLQQNPQLVYALFQALVVMNVVDSQVMQQIIASQGQQTTAPNMSVMAQGMPQAMQGMSQTSQGFIQQQPVAALPDNMVQEQQKQLLMQVLQLTPEQIASLPPDQQKQILELRQQIIG